MLPFLIIKNNQIKKHNSAPNPSLAKHVFNGLQWGCTWLPHCKENAKVTLSIWMRGKDTCLLVG